MSSQRDKINLLLCTRFDALHEMKNKSNEVKHPVTFSKVTMHRATELNLVLMPYLFQVKTKRKKAKRFANQLLSDVILKLAFIAISC